MNGQQAPEMIVGARSETGKVREENQDRMSRTQVPLGDLYVVADGMGGYQGGALAAQITVQSLEKYLRDVPAGTAPEEALNKGIEFANSEVHREANSGKPATAKMGSTVVLLLVTAGVARIAHVGDSRAYLYRNGELKLLTHDHTAVQRMIDANLLTAEEAEEHPDATVLSRAVGQKTGIEAEILPPFSLEIGDGILLCSDGLSRSVKDAHILEVLKSKGSEQEIAKKLVDLALDAGGEDNITVQFARYGIRPVPPPTKKAAGPIMAAVLAGVTGFTLGAGVFTYAGRINPVGEMSGRASKDAQGAIAGAPEPAPVMQNSTAVPANAPVADRPVERFVKHVTPPRTAVDAETQLKFLQKQVATLQRQLTEERKQTNTLKEQLTALQSERKNSSPPPETPPVETPKPNADKPQEPQP